MATLVDAVAEVFTFEALSGTTAAFTQGSSDRYIFGGIGWVGFGPAPTLTAFKHGGSSGTDITPGGADVAFFFGNGLMTAGSAIPGPSGTSTIYGASSGGLQGGAVGAAWEGVASADDYTTNSGVTGDINTVLCTVTVPNCVADQWVQGKFWAVSGNVSIDDFSVDVGEDTEILDQDLDPGVTFAAVCVVRKQATSNGSLTLEVRANSTSAPGTDAISWAGAAERLIDAEGGPTEYEASASQAVDVSETAAALLTALAAATQAVDVSDAATAQQTTSSSASQAVDVSDAASSQGTMAAAAAQAVDVNDTAAASQVTAGAAAQAVDVGDSASAQATLVAEATQSVDVGDSATALAAGDLLGTDSVDVADSASAAGTFSAVATDSTDVGDAASDQAVLPAAAEQAVDVDDSATAAGGNVYDLSADESVDLGDSASASGAGGGSNEEVLERLEELEQQLAAYAEEAAKARTFYVGGPDGYDDYPLRKLLEEMRAELRQRPKTDIAEQNAMLMQMFKAIVTQGNKP